MPVAIAVSDLYTATGGLTPIMAPIEAMTFACAGEICRPNGTGEAVLGVCESTSGLVVTDVARVTSASGPCATSTTVPRRLQRRMTSAPKSVRPAWIRGSVLNVAQFVDAILGELQVAEGQFRVHLVDAVDPAVQEVGAL